MKKPGLLVFTLIVLILVAPSQALSATSVFQAQQWTSPLNLFETEGRASEAVVVADPFGVIHVFWGYGAPGYEEDGSAQSIYYTRQQDGTWSEPVDVLVSPGGRVARMHSVAVDSDGYLHVVWSGGNALFYSRAYAPEAGSANGWTTPQTLTSGVNALEPTIAIGPDDTLYAVWTQSRAGLVLSRSEDGGDNWSTPQTIFQADRENELARWGRLAVDQLNRLHLVLTYTVEDPNSTYGRNDAHLLYYLRSDDRGATWSEPFLVTPEPDFGQINVATSGENTVHLVWNGRAGRHGRYHRWSQDGGETWSNTEEIIAPAPQNPIGTGGLTGFPAMMTDGTGALHVVSATGVGQRYLMWNSSTGWTAPVLISTGVTGGGVTNAVQSIESPSLFISEGNQLHVVFHDGVERIWYTSRTIDSPYQPPQVAPLAPIAATPAPTASLSVSTPAPSPLVPTLPPAAEAAPPTNSSTFGPLLVGILPAVLLVGAVVLLYKTRRSR